MGTNSTLFLAVVAALTSGFALLYACGNKLPEHLSKDEPAENSSEGRKNEESGEKVSPPFEVRDDLTGLLLVWFDGDGMHTASKRSEIPQAHRRYVRVDSLRIAPEERLDPEFVYIADLRRAASDGSYEVKKYPRDWFERLVDRETGVSRSKRAASPPDKRSNGNTKDAAASVVIYGAPWCGACRVAAQYLKKRNVAFVEKDIEKDEQAYAEMQQKARAAGVQPGGLPLIDFRGRIVSGFNPDILDQLIK
ncbi:MAG: hypothetical protein JXA30_07820 [Deltaproteobacteria bacterium]|nr:hypothetical protein [Deltaproteobacteria bacterium]